MLSKNEIKRLTSLHHTKFRDEQHCFLVEGPKIVDEVINCSLKTVNLYALQEWTESKTAENYKTKGISITTVSPSELARISQLKTPNLVVAEIEIPKTEPKLNLELPILALDNISDPGNMGTIIRTADWFGISQIVCSENCVELYNSKVLQSTMGSFTRVNILYKDLKNWFSSLPKDKMIYGAVMNGEDFYTTKTSKAPIFLIGNESKGISESLMPFISKRITIPKIGGAESLNASIATAIILSEFTRQIK